MHTVLAKTSILPVMIQDIQAIIFDMDGTMLDNMAIHNQTWVAFFGEMGIPLEIGEFHERTAGRTNPEVLKLILGNQLPPDQLEALGEAKEVRYRLHLREHASPVAGLHDFLNAARRAGLKLGVATAAPPVNVDVTLGCLGLNDFFDTVVHAGHIRRGKPDPEIFLTAAARLGVPPQNCLVFEDARMGVEAARRAGMRVVLMTTTISAVEGERIEGVVQVVGDFHEAMDLVADRP